MRTGATQSDYPLANSREAFAAIVEFIPKEAIATSEELRNPLVRTASGNIIRAKQAYFIKGDPFTEDRISVSDTDLIEVFAADESVMPG